MRSTKRNTGPRLFMGKPYWLGGRPKVTEPPVDLLAHCPFSRSKLGKPHPDVAAFAFARLVVDCRGVNKRRRPVQMITSRLHQLLHQIWASGAYRGQLLTNRTVGQLALRHEKTPTKPVPCGVLLSASERIRTSSPWFRRSERKVYGAAVRFEQTLWQKGFGTN